MVRRHRAGIPRRFAEMEPVLIEQGLLRAGMVGQARSLLAQGRAMRDFVVPKLQADPTYLLARGEHAAGRSTGTLAAFGAEPAAI
jgi:aminoglycoside N3'-acetyltransferase